MNTQIRNITADDLLPGVTQVNTMFDDIHTWDLFDHAETMELNSSGQVVHQGQRDWAASEDYDVTQNLTPVSAVTVYYMKKVRTRMLPWMLQSPTGDDQTGAGYYYVTIDQIRQIRNP
jgi:hypothetical protein